MEVGNKLNPQRSYRKGFALKGLCQHIIKTNNPSTIGPGELLTVRFPDLKENQVTIPGTTKLTFNTTLVGTDVNRTLVKNLGRNIQGWISDMGINGPTFVPKSGCFLTILVKVCPQKVAFS